MTLRACRSWPAAAGVMLAGAAGLAQAHTGGAHSVGASHALWAGWVHPFSGADHLLAFLALGILASMAAAAGRGRWALTAPLAGLGVGFLAAFALPAVPLELALALSLVALGGLIAFRQPGPARFLGPAAALLAALHGYAHALAIPAAVSGSLFGLGLGAASAVLLAAGYGFGRSPLGRYAHGPVGMAVAGTGLALAALGG